MSVLEHMPYTSMLALTYLLPGEDAEHPERVPDLRLRAYHDARLLEADAFSHSEAKRHNMHAARNQAGERELEQRWTRNMMLNKWLEYCAERGHRFTV